MIIPVILAGGSGTRLWPMSRTAFPKQFLSFDGEQTMLQQTLDRLTGLPCGQPVVITNDEHRFLVAEQARQQGVNVDILLEPIGRNTAPAIALAAFHLLKERSSPSPVMLVMASDHIIQDVAAFQRATMSLLPDVRDGKFGTLGIVPSEPATGYGYIKPCSALALSQVECFVEKPNASIAQQYCDDGYLWNSGTFLIRADRYLEVLKGYRPDIYRACEQAIHNINTDMDFIRVDHAAFEACATESIDYAVMEPLSETGDVIVASLEAGWSDVGSWSTLWQKAEKDQHGNALLGGMEHQHTLLQDTHNSLIFSQKRLVATLGVDNLVVVDTPDAVLVANKDKAQSVKDIIVEMNQQGRNEHLSHQLTYRPWGYYDVVTFGEGYKVKKILVNPGASLSLQRHQFRAEHWVVVYGTARVTKGEDTYCVQQNESSYISPGEIHKLENPGPEVLVIIEVQTGSYLEEDDIERLEDRYGRTSS